MSTESMVIVHSIHETFHGTFPWILWLFTMDIVDIYHGHCGHFPWTLWTFSTPVSPPHGPLGTHLSILYNFKKNSESSKLFDCIAFMYIMIRLNDLLIIMTRKNDQELFARNRWLLSHYTSNPCDIDLTRHCLS